MVAKASDAGERHGEEVACRTEDAKIAEIDHGLPQNLKLIILLITKMPIAIQTAQPDQHQIAELVP